MYKNFLLASFLSAGLMGAQHNQKIRVNRLLDVVTPVLPIQGIIKDYLDTHDQYEMLLGNFSSDSIVIAFSADGLKAAFAKPPESGKTSIYIYDLKKRQLEREYIVSFHDLPTYQRQFISIALSRDGKNIAYTHGGYAIRVLSNEKNMEEISGGQLWCEKMDRVGISALAHSPDGKFLACGGVKFTNDSREFFVTIWDLANKKIAYSVVFSHPVLDISYSPDGKFLAATQHTNVVEILDTAKYNIVKTFNLVAAGDYSEIGWLAYTYRSNYLAVESKKSECFNGFKSKALEIWDLARNRRIDEKVFADFINRIAYSPDNRYFAVCKHDAPIEIFSNQAVEITQADEAAEREAMRKQDK